MGKELVERRIQEADRHGEPAHLLEDADEVFALHRQQLGERALTLGAIIGKDHLAHRGDAIFLEEHVLGAAKADALRAERACDARVERRVGVRANFHRARRVGPDHELTELTGERGGSRGNRAFVDAGPRIRRS